MVQTPFFTSLFFLLSFVAAKEFCTEDRQIIVDKLSGTLLGNNQLQVNNESAIYPGGTYWAQNDTYVLCPCKIGRCVAKCSNLIQEDGGRYHVNAPLDFEFKIHDEQGRKKHVIFNKHFHIFNEGKKGVPYYFLSFQAFLDKNKSDANEAFPRTWNEQTANKVCFLLDGKKIVFLEAPEGNLKAIAQLVVIWIFNATCLALLVVALYQAGDTRSIYGKCLIRHTASMMLANLGIFLCTQLYLLGTFLPAWLCFSFGFITYFFEMCVLFWLTCMIHGICMTFSSNNSENENVMGTNFSRFKLYSIISWNFPLILTLLLLATVFYFDTSTNLHNGILYSQFNKFQYRYNCFITRWQLTYFLFKLLPEIVFVLLNTYMFGKTSKSIYKTQMEVQKVLKKKTERQIRCFSILVFVKLFFLMGVTRILEILYWIIFYQQQNVYFKVLQSMGALQGLWLLLFCIVTKEKVREVFQKWLEKACKCFSFSKKENSPGQNSVSFKTTSTGLEQNSPMLIKMENERAEIQC